MGHGLHDEQVFGNRERHTEAAYLGQDCPANCILFERVGPEGEVDRDAGPLVAEEEDTRAEREAQRIGDPSGDPVALAAGQEGGPRIMVRQPRDRVHDLRHAQLAEHRHGDLTLLS
jgi:hypothetical protein